MLSLLFWIWQTRFSMSFTHNIAHLRHPAHRQCPSYHINPSIHNIPSNSTFYYWYLYPYRITDISTVWCIYCIMRAPKGNTIRPSKPRARVAQWVRSLDLATHTSLSPIRNGFAPSFVNLQKGCIRHAEYSWNIAESGVNHQKFKIPNKPSSNTLLFFRLEWNQEKCVG